MHTSLSQCPDYFSDKGIVFWSRNDVICISVRRVCCILSFFDAMGLALKYTYSHFPTFMGNDGVVRREVPIPMVALVATAVSAAMSM